MWKDLVGFDGSKVPKSVSMCLNYNRGVKANPTSAKLSFLPERAQLSKPDALIAIRASIVIAEKKLIKQRTR